MTSQLNPKNWDELKQSTRQLETEIGAKISQFRQLVLAGQRSYGQSFNSTQMTQLSQQLQTLLSSLEHDVNSMNQFQFSHSSNSAMLYSINRHKDQLNEFKRDFGKLQQDSNSLIQSIELLGGNNNGFLNQSYGDQDQLLQERRKIDNVNRKTDEVLNIAYAAQQSIFNQGTSLYNQRQRIRGNVLNQLPQLNTLLNKIGVKKRKDALILGAVIAFCIISLILFKFGL